MEEVDLRFVVMAHRPARTLLSTNVPTLLRTAQLLQISAIIIQIFKSSMRMMTSHVIGN
jgi:hypothetical protein